MEKVVGPAVEYCLERMANNVDPDQAAENVKQCRPWSDCWEWEIV